MGLIRHGVQRAKIALAQEEVNQRQHAYDRATKRVRILRAFARMAVVLAGLGLIVLIALGGVPEDEFQLETGAVVYRCDADGGIEGASGTNDESRQRISSDGVPSEPCQRAADERRWEHRREQIVLTGLILISGLAARHSFQKLPQLEGAVEHDRQLLEEAQAERSALTERSDGSSSEPQRRP
ncbi:MAG: hypothetical protein WD638_09425 [Nitriliruptoraceae bacterium]